MFLAICDWQQKVGKEVDCEIPVEEEKAENDTAEDRARGLERSAAEGPSDEGGGVGVGEKRRFRDACDVGGGEAPLSPPTPARESLFDEGLSIPQWLFRDLCEPTRSLLGIRIHLDNIDGFAGPVRGTVLSVDMDNRLYTVQLDGNSTPESMKPPVWGWTEEQESEHLSERGDFTYFWLRWTKTQEAEHQSELVEEDLYGKACENHQEFLLNLSGCTYEGYVSDKLKENDCKGFSSAHVVITNEGRALMLIQRLKKAKGEAKLILGLTGGQRKFSENEDAWTCACREADEETGGYAAMCSRVAAPPAHVAWLGIKQLERSKWVGGKVVYMYETADHSLAEDIQKLGRPPEGREGLLPPEGAPLTAVWVPLARFREWKFRRDYLPPWTRDERIWIDLTKCHS